MSSFVCLIAVELTGEFISIVYQYLIRFDKDAGKKTNWNKHSNNPDYFRIEFDTVYAADISFLQ